MKNELINFIIIIFIICIVMRFIDGATGQFLLSFFIGIIFVSEILFKPSATEIEINTPKDVYKNTDFKVILKISSKKPLTVMTYIVRVKATQHFKNTRFDPVAVIVMGKTARELTLNVEPYIAGTAQITFDIIKTDIMRTSLRLRKETIVKEVKIAYDTPTDINYSAPILKVYENIQDEPDDFETNSMTARNVSPGVDHRPYVPGDSLKKINWKLSARMNGLMTRKDERTNGITVIFDIDYSIPEGGKFTSFEEERDAQTEIYLNHQLLVETALGMKEFCKNSGFNCIDMDMAEDINAKYTALFIYSNVIKDIVNDDMNQLFTTNVICQTWQILPNGELKYNG